MAWHDSDSIVRAYPVSSQSYSGPRFLDTSLIYSQIDHSIKRPFDGHSRRGLPGQCFRACFWRSWKDWQKDGLLEKVLRWQACRLDRRLRDTRSLWDRHGWEGARGRGLWLWTYHFSGRAGIGSWALALDWSFTGLATDFVDGWGISYLSLEERLTSI